MQENQENQEDPKIYSSRPAYDVSGDLIDQSIENDFLRAFRKSQGQNKNLDTGGIESFEAMNVNASGGDSTNRAVTIIDLTTGDPIDGKIFFLEDTT